MSAQMLGPSAQQQQQQPQQLSQLHPQNIHHPPRQQQPDLQQLIRRAQFLRQHPQEQKSPNELETVLKYISALSQMQVRGLNSQLQQQQALPNGHSMPNGAPAGPASIMSGPVPSQPYAPPSHPTPSFTQEQINVVRAQIQAFKLLSKGMPIPETLLQSIRLSNSAIADLERTIQPPDIQSRVVDAAVKVAKAESSVESSPPVQRAGTEEAVKTEEQEASVSTASGDLPKGSFLEENSGTYPYSAYHHPFSYLKRSTDSDPYLYATRLQRLLIPTIMPAGLDAYQILNERDRYAEARIQQRIRELEALASTIGDGKFETGVESEDIPMKDENEVTDLKALMHPSPTAHGKLRALIEVKALRLLEKQRVVRATVAERLYHASMVPLNRTDLRRIRKPTLRDARMTEQLERKQRAERERRAKHKHVEQLGIICTHGREVIGVNRAAQDRITRLNRAVLAFHAHTEKEEQKRIERISKERLRALKADDEEAYMKLIDTAKDTRITHLLRQTDAYLDSLAQAVALQQNEAGVVDINFEQEDGPASEATFGAQRLAPEEGAEERKVDYYAVAHRISEKITRQPGILIGGTLKEYQMKGLQWMVSLYNNRLNGILADEMGLGKTIQTISLITFLIEAKKQRGPYLVIVPLSTMTNWSGEFAKWAPSVRMISYKGNPTQRRVLQQELRMGQFQVLLTTYEYIIKDRPHLSKIKWIHMIIDEGHRMKNTQSKLAQTLTTYYHSRYRLILTGTPLQNNLPELWALLNFVLPKIFNSVKSFDEWFNTPFANSGTGDKIELNEEEALLIIRRLHKVLRPFLLRRLKKDVEAELPDKVEKVIKIRMSALQSQLYKQMKKHKMIADGKDVKGKSGGVRGLSNELMQLRKICQHPYLFDSVEDKISPSGLIDEKLIRTSGKIELLSRILPKFFSTGHRVLIFFQMTKVMDIMEDFLKMMKWKYLRLDGGTKTDERASFVQLFNAPQSEFMVFILSTRAGGLGLNLQTADTVIIFDSDWNPHADLQAQDRAHRIGQTKAVLILRFITEKSVEEAMYQRARFKLDIDDKVIQAGRFDNKSTAEEQEEFLRSILEADQEEENEEAGDMNDDELNELIARSEEENVIFRQMDIQRERDAVEIWRAAGNRGKPPLPLMQLEELPECYQTDEPFDLKEEEEILEGRGQRRRNIVSYNDGLSDEAWAMALEEGEDIEALSERTRDKKERRATNKLLRDAEASGRGTPASDTDSRGRKGKKGKSKMANVAAVDHDTPVGVKRKRGGKSMSVTPSINADDDDEDHDPKRRKTKVPPVSSDGLTPAIRERMKKAFAECHKAVLACEDETGRKRCELFRELPDRAEYPDYYQIITQPICLAQLKKRANTGYYKNVQQFKAEFKLMFANAHRYNQEGSWVVLDADEMAKAFDATFDRLMTGSGLPEAPPAASEAPSSGPSQSQGPNGDAGKTVSAVYDEALTPMDEDERPAPVPRRGRKTAVVSDEEYLTSEDD